MQYQPDPVIVPVCMFVEPHIICRVKLDGVKFAKFAFAGSVCAGPWFLFEPNVAQASVSGNGQRFAVDFVLGASFEERSGQNEPRSH